MFRNNVSKSLLVAVVGLGLAWTGVGCERDRGTGPAGTPPSGEGVDRDTRPLEPVSPNERRGMEPGGMSEQEPGIRQGQPQQPRPQPGQPNGQQGQQGQQGDG